MTRLWSLVIRCWSRMGKRTTAGVRRESRSSAMAHPPRPRGRLGMGPEGSRTGKPAPVFLVFPPGPEGKRKWVLLDLEEDRNSTMN